ncbi:suppressor of cytokine signaling 2 isoform X1 [Pyrgilauda ruficollis]|uniref:suppressor of cytokine signaling 2 isoform X1 n=1 Tax=Pyrgilauda ruficollis TaxID=221976 RepID=UPI001B86B2AE|nr:suppressor of cytokine signaling 2 isoform X1 [Pyrgilauda ruficollis]
MTLRSAESLESAESSGERWGHPGAAAPVAEECREAEQLAAAMEELRRAGKPGRPGRGKRPGRRRCPGRGRAARRGSPPGREGNSAAVRRLAIAARRCEVAFPRRRGAATTPTLRGLRRPKRKLRQRRAPAAARDRGPGAAAGRGGRGAASSRPRVPALPSPAWRRLARPRRMRGLVAGGGKGFLSSSQPRQDRSYLAGVVFLSLSFRSLDKTHFSSSLLRVTQSGRSAGCQPVPCGRSAGPGGRAAGSRGTRPCYSRGGLPGRRLQCRLRRTLQESLCMCRHT